MVTVAIYSASEMSSVWGVRVCTVGAEVELRMEKWAKPKVKMSNIKYRNAKSLKTKIRSHFKVQKSQEGKVYDFFF